MKICIFGAGAVGGYLATRCHLGGAETSVIARGQNLAAIRSAGLRVQTPEGALMAPVAATEDPRELGPQDVVIVAVKAPALAGVARAIGPLLGPGTAVVFAMNGIPWWYFYRHGGNLDGTQLATIDPERAVWEAVGPERALGCVVYSASEVVSPGVVRLAQANSRLVIGEPDGTVSARATAVADVLTGGGLATSVTGDIRDVIWSKLQNNVASGLMAILTQCTVDQITARPSCEAAMRGLLAEIIAVAEALGRAPSRDIDKVVAHMQALAHKPSILQDLEQGRKMEIESLYTIILRLAEMVGVATPKLDLMVTLASLRAEAAGLNDFSSQH
ncbi:ketopantoate reductase family protein [Parasedimentitalea psychrophila]|uniref:2-dehydropantoate 2-reductase n=1 Tax=Parasedimentitalea psychrophila TaxID=2997337 RepID=A0A9Y2L0Q4_9RHOB|nr:2-dehydropantoate 2-reductase [Parasedimentitalea psychrophila]WIY26561.1 2-dehydropantoate 2-reductase [Parasedimentitalea psychrophila]